jgi:LPS-assembly lipoprotein
MARRTWLVVLLGAVLVAGCGFHLRGKVDLAPSLLEPYIRGPDPDINDLLADALEFSDARPVADESIASSVIDMYFARFARDVRTLDSRGLATGYVLRYRVEFRVVDADGEVLLPDAVIDMRRNFNYDANEVLQKEDEEEFIREDMQREIVQRMLRMLASIGRA